MNKSIEEKLQTWDDWSFEGTEHHQFLSFKILPLDEKLKAAEDLADLAEAFLERGKKEGSTPNEHNRYRPRQRRGPRPRPHRSP